ncbi:MAG: hypothetical protein LBC64_02830 [Fibromonadaceae bacterium]|jgi:hypothetical protein|nr:hypothetical protein [Fibromonadaceae bacterium]
MQALKKIMVANELSPVMDIPNDMQNIKVEVTVTPYLEYKNTSAFTPRVKSLLGSFKIPKNCSLDYKKEISEALEEKYL